MNDGLGNILLMVEVIAFAFIIGLFVAIFLLKRKVNNDKKQQDS